jgi:hypothetical protein
MTRVTKLSGAGEDKITFRVVDVIDDLPASIPCNRPLAKKSIPIDWSDRFQLSAIPFGKLRNGEVLLMQGSHHYE